jgi:hypothetical protein
MTSPLYTEVVNPRHTEYMSTLSYDDFFKLFPAEDNEDNGEWSVKDKKQYYKLVIDYTKLLIKNNFRNEINYKASDKNPNGRIYSSCPMSLQRLHKSARAFLTKGLYHDYDMCNCHFNIFNHLCCEEGLSTYWIKKYINNRSQILDDNNATKSHILAKLNTDNARAKGDWNKPLRLLIQECNINKKVLYKKFVTEFTQTNDKNPISSIINKKMCTIENDILQKVLGGLGAEYEWEGYPSVVPCFDGFMTDKEIDVSSLPADICNWTEKPIESSVTVPEDFTFVPDAVVVNENSYEDMKVKFEKTHAKVINKSIYVMITHDGEIIFKTKTEMIVSYEHMSFKKYVDKGDYGFYQKQGFILEWMQDDTIATYDDIGCYPNIDECPPNIFNTWSQFAVEKMIPCEMNNEYVDVFLKHISVLCDNDTAQQNIILLYLSHMFKYPTEKSFTPVLISQEGGGKGTLMKIICRLIGENKYLETCDPLEYVFGRFNDTMTDAFVVNINECRKKDMIDVLEKLKGLVTDPTLWVQGKGTKKYKIKSFHRIIVTTNNEDPVPTKYNDRRNHIIRSSDELIGNYEYFKHINELIINDDFIYSIYLYLMSLDTPKTFNVNSFPKSQYHQDIQEASRDYTDLWLESYVIKNGQLNDTKQVPSSTVFDSYKEFIHENQLKCDRSCVSFMKHLMCMRINGITKTKTHGNRCTEFNFELLNKKYMIGCQI